MTSGNDEHLNVPLVFWVDLYSKFLEQVNQMVARGILKEFDFLFIRMSRGDFNSSITNVCMSVYSSERQFCSSING